MGQNISQLRLSWWNSLTSLASQWTDSSKNASISRWGIIFFGEPRRTRTSNRLIKSQQNTLKQLNKLSVSQLAELSNLGKAYISQVKHGKRAPSPKLLEALADLERPKKQPKRRRLWLNDGSCIRLRPEHKDHVWSYDFVIARTAEGRVFRILNIIDEYTRECLAILVKRRITSQDVIDQLFQLIILRGIPGHIRSDNGPAFTAKAIFRS